MLSRLSVRANMITAYNGEHIRRSFHLPLAEFLSYMNPVGSRERLESKQNTISCNLWLNYGRCLFAVQRHECQIAI